MRQPGAGGLRFEETRREPSGTSTAATFRRARIGERCGGTSARCTQARENAAYPRAGRVHGRGKRFMVREPVSRAARVEW